MVFFYSNFYQQVNTYYFIKIQKSQLLLTHIIKAIKIRMILISISNNFKFFFLQKFP